MTITTVSNLQSSLVLDDAIEIYGVFPPRDGGTASTAYLGEIYVYAFDFAPAGDYLTNGQTLAITTDTALFSIIGTTFGGNGTSTFVLPNLQGEGMIGSGNGAGLPVALLGATTGSASVTLTPPELPPDLGGASAAFNDYQPSVTVTYSICVSGNTPTVGPGTPSLALVGEVNAFAGNFAPAGFLQCQGQTLAISEFETLYDIIGTTYGGDGITTFDLPDLQGRTIVGASAADPVGTYLGQPTVSLSNGQAPTGGGASAQPFDNVEPSLAMEYLIATEGVYPSQDGGGLGTSPTPYIGQIQAFAGTFVPTGWALADGQTLLISSNPNLFNLIGTTYGGNGNTTFALPDLNDATVVGQGDGAVIGQKLGGNSATVTAANLPDPVANNYSGDGTSDILLQNSAGVLVDWIVTNGAVTGGNILGSEPGWTAAATGDFTGDGTADILLQNGGNVVDWTLQNGTLAGAALIGNSTGYTIVGSGDFSGDRTSDILLRNSAGALVDWMMSDGAVTAGNYLGTAAGYAVVGTGDFTGNGVSDILLENTAGIVVDWTMKNGVVSGGAVVGNASGYTIVGTGDFTGNGTTDILLQNSAGALVDWIMSNGAVTASHYLGTAAGWTVSAVGDYTGNGVSDILLANAGAVVDWTMQNGVVSGASLIGNTSGFAIKH